MSSFNEIAPYRGREKQEYFYSLSPRLRLFLISDHIVNCTILYSSFRS